MSQVITLQLAIHSGIALTGPGAELFIAARPRSETHSQTHTHTQRNERMHLHVLTNRLNDLQSKPSWKNMLILSQYHESQYDGVC